MSVTIAGFNSGVSLLYNSSYEDFNNKVRCITVSSKELIEK